MDFFAVEANGSDVNPGICIILKHAVTFDSEGNRSDYLMKINRNSQIYGSFVYYCLFRVTFHGNVPKFVPMFASSYLRISTGFLVANQMRS